MGLLLLLKPKVWGALFVLLRSKPLMRVRTKQIAKRPTPKKKISERFSMQIMQKMTEPFHGHSSFKKEELGQVNPAVILMKSMNCNCTKVESRL